MTQKRNDDYSVLKALTVLLVVLGHVTTFYTYAGGAIVYPCHPLLDLITRGIYLFHMQLFMFLSGAVYCACIQAGKYRSLTGFVFSKSKRLLVPYFVFGILNVAPVMIALKITGESYVHYVLHGIFLCKNNRHLWFLATLFGIFLIVRLAKPLLDRVPALIWGLFACSLGLFLNYTRFPSTLCLYNITRMLVFFLTGYLFHQYRERILPLIQKCWPLALGALGGLYFCLVTKSGIVKGGFASLCGIWLCLFAVQYLGDGIRNSRFLSDLQRDSMGIYLFHPMFNYVLFWLLKDAGMNPILQSILAFFVVMVLSVISTRGLRKLGLGALMGE